MTRTGSVNQGMTVPELAAKPRSGYARGLQGVEQILRQSERLLIEEGMDALTMRRIAAESGMTAGNLAYYFKSKDELIVALLDAISESYRKASQSVVLPATQSSAESLGRLIEIYLGNIASRRTTRLFLELWPLASRNEEIGAKLRNIYEAALDLFASQVRHVSPKLSAERCRKLALFMVASLEGQTAFVGCGMPYAAERDALMQLARQTFVNLATEPD